MTTRIKARLFQGLIFLTTSLITFFVVSLFIDASLVDHRAGILGMISAAVAGILTPKMKTIESQSGKQIQVTSIFIKGAKFIK